MKNLLGDTIAIIHGTAQIRDGQTLAVRWSAVKVETRGWQFDSIKVTQ
ncbi:MAG: hypothetical protein Q4A06_01140 [Cardiobacteriaceae bacterium]|nr:hypothetical protein [Cardiobacteriaceae bacterium]